MPKSTKPSQLQIQETLAVLPPEVIINIISRIQVGCLLRFRSIAKPWRSIIDSRYLVDLHLRQSADSQSHLGLIVRNKADLYYVSFNFLNDAVELNHPLMCYSNRIGVVGSCNGLLCICNVAEDIALWNPSTKKHRLLPSLPLDRQKNYESGMRLCGARVYGVGYDAVHDDYKVVRIAQFIGLDYLTFESEVKVYSQRMNTWKSVGAVPYVLSYTRKMGVLVSGCVHWVVTRNHEFKESSKELELVVGFDMVDEVFREVPMPEIMDMKCEIDLGLLGTCLCIVAKYEDGVIDVWTLKEYGVKASWSKLFSVGKAQKIKSVKPLLFSNNGCEVLFEQDHKKLVWFNLKSQRVKSVEVRGLPDFFEAVVCMESLVSVHPTKRVDTKKPEGKKCKKRDDFLAEGFKLVL